jgi:NSS family neurotransmitter:Na+ symporter
MLQPAIALLEEGLQIGRRTSVAMLGFVTLIGSLFVVYFSKDLVALDTMDFWVGTFCIYILATFQVILFGWVLGIKRGMREIDRGASIRVPRLVGGVLKYIAPVYLIGIFILWASQNSGDYLETLRTNRVAQFTISFILIVAVLFALLINQSVKRWRVLERGEGERCHACGVDLARTRSADCPECGAGLPAISGASGRRVSS